MGKRKGSSPSAVHREAVNVVGRENSSPSECDDASDTMAKPDDSLSSGSDAAPITTAKRKDALPTELGVNGRGVRLLSLDGGGVRGYSSLLILQSLMHQINSDNPPKPCDVFDMIGGTGTGGYGCHFPLVAKTDSFSLIAIMLGRLEMTVDECINAYIILSEYVFQKPRQPFDWRLKVKPRYISKNLEEAIKHIVYHHTGNSEARMMEKTNPRCKM